MNLADLINAAQAKSQEIIEYKRTHDSYMAPRGNAWVTEGRFGVYLVPVTQRTRSMREHFRATFYLDGKRVKRQVIEAEMAKQQ